MSIDEMNETIRRQTAEGTLPFAHRIQPREPRGRRLKLAVTFVREFPIGSVFTVEEFDQWCADNGLLAMPSTSAVADKKSDGWKAHIQRRHEAKLMLNNMGTQSRIAEYPDAAPFWIASIGDGEWKVRSPIEQMADGLHGRRVNSLSATWTDRLELFMDSGEFERLSAKAQAKATVVYEAGIRFNERVKTEQLLLRSGCRELQTIFQAEGATLQLEHDSAATDEDEGLN